MKLFKIQGKEVHKDYYINPNKIVIVTSSNMDDTVSKIIMDNYGSIIIDESVDSLVSRINKL